MARRGESSLGIVARGGFEILQLTRSHSAAGAALTVWLGGHLSGAAWEWWWLMPMGVAFLLSAAGNAFNDAHDVAIDRINRPHRPLPRGALTVAAARRISSACVVGALLLAFPFGLVSVGGTILGAILLYLYTTHLKGIPLVGNVTVGVLTGMAMGYGGLLGGRIPAVILPALTLSLLFGGREILKTIHDLAGDRAQSVRTLATVAGPRASLMVASLCFCVALLLFAGWTATHPTAWPVLLATIVVFATILISLWMHGGEHTTIAWALRWSKVTGLMILLALSVL